MSAANGLRLHVVEELGSPDALLVPGGSRVDGMDTGVPREIRLDTLPRLVAITNPGALKGLSDYGTIVRQNRVVDDGNVVTAYPMPPDVWRPNG